MILKNVINLNNNYYLKIINNDNIEEDVIDINNMMLFKIFKSKKFLLKIDFKNLDEKKYKRILKNLLFIKKIVPKKKKQIEISKDSKILLGYIMNYEENNKQQNEFLLGINAIFFNTRYERYNYIYDTVCDYLDDCFYGKNLCDFKDDKCGEKRNTSSVIGCCRHYKNKLIGPILPHNFIKCEYLINKRCTIKCIFCKLYTCDYLKHKGIKFKLKDILLLDVFFNPIQKYFIKYSVYTTKDKIIKRLMLL